MKDYNFFASFDKKKLTFDLKSPTTIIVATAVVAILFCAAVSAANLITAQKLASTNAALTEKKSSATYIQVQKAKDDLLALDQYDKIADKVIANYQKATTFNSQFFTDFVKLIPQDVKLTSINLTDYTVSLQCSATDRKPIAVFLSNLENSGMFESTQLVSVTATISQGTGISSNEAVIQAVLKEGDAK